MATSLAYVFIGDKKQTVAEWKHKLGTTNEQMEILLLKYPDMDRDNLKYVTENLFDSTDDILSHPLNETEILTIADDIGITLDKENVTTFLSKLPSKQENKTFFTEIACFMFSKPFIRDMSDLKDSEAEAKTIAAGSKAKAITDKIAKEKEAEEKAKEDAKRMDEKIQAGLQRGGSVANRAAMFEKNIQTQKSDPMAVADKVRHDNQMKKEQKEAEKEYLKAQTEEAEKQKILEEKAAEAVKQAKINKLAEQMGKFGINTPTK